MPFVRRSAETETVSPIKLPQTSHPFMPYKYRNHALLLWVSCCLRLSKYLIDLQNFFLILAMQLTFRPYVCFATSATLEDGFAQVLPDLAILRIHTMRLSQASQTSITQLGSVKIMRILPRCLHSYALLHSPCCHRTF